MEQLRVLGEQAGVATLAHRRRARARSRSPSAPWPRAKVGGYDVLILDTAGRQHIDEQLMTEVAAIKAASQSARDPAGRRQPDRPGRGQYRQDLQRPRAALRHHPDPRRRRCPRRRGALDARGHRRADQVPRRRRKAGRAGSLPSRARRRAASSTWAMSSRWSRRRPRRFDKEEAEKLAAKMKKGQFDMNDLAEQLQPDEEAGRHEGRARHAAGRRQDQGPARRRRPGRQDPHAPGSHHPVHDQAGTRAIPM